MKNYIDVAIIGAGISGISAATYLKNKCPNKNFTIFEKRGSIGGTWDLFSYPGIRSDSDMFTLGFSFKPWKERKAIADGPSIMKYLDETVRENELGNNIKYNQSLIKAEWSSEKAMWKLTTVDSSTNKKEEVNCKFLFMCSGYYSYENGYTPKFSGIENFNGTIIHPQQWSDKINYDNKDVVVIGSGATAVTLVPEIAKKANYVTMLQRSPTYIVAYPDQDMFSNILRMIFPAKISYALTRFRNVLFQQWLYTACRKFPKRWKKLLIDRIREYLSDEEIKKNFTPNYNPWEQRMCLVPNGDFFTSIKENKASVVTDEIANFTNNSICLKSGDELPADLIVTATGLNLELLGGVEIVVDGKIIDTSQTMTYKSMMFSDVPNFISTFGYINASWTLKADLTSQYACRLINLMDKNKYKYCTPKIPDNVEEDRDWLASEFSSGYIQRAKHLFPKQGNKAPWKNYQNYIKDWFDIKYNKLQDPSMIFYSEE